MGGGGWSKRRHIFLEKHRPTLRKRREEVKNPILRSKNRNRKTKVIGDVPTLEKKVSQIQSPDSERQEKYS